MTRLVEVLVGMSALCGIATFVIARGAWKRLQQKLGRKPKRHPEVQGPDGVIHTSEQGEIERRDQ